MNRVRDVDEREERDQDPDGLYRGSSVRDNFGSRQKWTRKNGLFNGFLGLFNGVKQFTFSLVCRT